MPNEEVCFAIFNMLLIFQALYHPWLRIWKHFSRRMHSIKVKHTRPHVYVCIFLLQLCHLGGNVTPPHYSVAWSNAVAGVQRLYQLSVFEEQGNIVCNQFWIQDTVPKFQLKSTLDKIFNFYNVNVIKTLTIVW